ncbi:MAG: alkaline phosphatase [Marinilabiliales bacterium]|nr:MAG: alkaline phosphatase [Marinilabiliales bacterium]
MKKLIYFIVMLLIFPFASCNISKPEKVKIAKKKRQPNVILMIGDGMGLSEVSSTFYYGNRKPNFSRFKEIGLNNTSSADKKITDSAASGTALATGKKTYNGAIGLDADSLIVPNLVEVLSNLEYNTAIIATSSITHATPASFFAHVKQRKMEYDIAEQLPKTEVDFFAAGGLKYFTNRDDGKDILKSLVENGFALNDTINYHFDISKKYAYILAEDALPSMLDGRGEFLSEYTQHALNYLSMSDKPFFVMIEASQIDWGGHAKNADYLISEMLDFDKTIGTVMDFAEQDANTLVIVLADHETGGFTLATDNGDYGKIKPTFCTGGHSTTLIPVFAFGPGADNFKGIYENTNIFDKIIQITE